RTGLLRAPAALGVPFALVRIAALRAPAAENGAEAAVAPSIGVRNEDVGGRLARDEAALRLVAQHRDELGAIVGLGAERLIRNDDRGPRQCGRRDAVEHLARDGDAVERILGVVPAVDADRRPAQARIAT